MGHSKVKDMRWMFHNATNFDQNIYNWSGYAATSPVENVRQAGAFNEKFACIVKNQVSSCKISSKHAMQTYWRNEFIRASISVY